MICCLTILLFASQPEEVGTEVTAESSDQPTPQEQEGPDAAGATPVAVSDSAPVETLSAVKEIEEPREDVQVGFIGDLKGQIGVVGSERDSSSSPSFGGTVGFIAVLPEIKRASGRNYARSTIIASYSKGSRPSTIEILDAQAPPADISTSEYNQAASLKIADFLLRPDTYSHAVAISLAWHWVRPGRYKKITSHLPGLMLELKGGFANATIDEDKKAVLPAILPRFGFDYRWRVEFGSTKLNLGFFTCVALHAIASSGKTVDRLTKLLFSDDGRRTWAGLHFGPTLAVNNISFTMSMSVLGGPELDGLRGFQVIPMLQFRGDVLFPVSQKS